MDDLDGQKLAEIIRAKQAKPIESVEDWIVPGVFDSDEEVDEFNAAVRAWRRGFPDAGLPS